MSRGIFFFKFSLTFALKFRALVTRLRLSSSKLIWFDSVCLPSVPDGICANLSLRFARFVFLFMSSFLYNSTLRLLMAALTSGSIFLYSLRLNVLIVWSVALDMFGISSFLNFFTRVANFVALSLASALSLIILSVSAFAVWTWVRRLAFNWSETLVSVLISLSRATNCDLMLVKFLFLALSLERVLIKLVLAFWSCASAVSFLAVKLAIWFVRVFVIPSEVDSFSICFWRLVESCCCPFWSCFTKALASCLAATAAFLFCCSCLIWAFNSFRVTFEIPWSLVSFVWRFVIMFSLYFCSFITFKSVFS